MKLYILISTIFISSGLVAQATDTIFLKREVADTPYPFYHAVFIDPGSKFRTELTSFSFCKYDSATYFEQLKPLEPFHGKQTFLNNFPRKWIALYQLNGKYYLYRPSDFGNHFRFEITDSTTIDFSMEGAEPSRLNNISFSSTTQIEIDRTNYWEGKKVIINLLDVAKGLALFSFGPTKYKRAGYQLLMVDAAKAHLFPTIVNYCLTDKQHELAFDKIDFKSLLQ